MEDVIVNLIGLAAQKYPVLLTIFSVMGVCRTVFKPVFEFLKKATEASDTAWDNELLNKIVASKAYKIASFLLDWSASIKLPKKQGVASAPAQDQKAA